MVFPSTKVELNKCAASFKHSVKGD